MTSKQQWLEFLQTQHAVIESDKVLSFGQSDEFSALTGKTVVAPLDDYAVIRVTGEDNADFLQNQFSNDVRQVSDSQSQLNAYCSPKGRVLSLFRLIKQEQAYFLLLPQQRLQPTLSRLKMFVLRSKVQLEDVSDTMGALGIAGENARVVAESILPAVPEDVDGCHFDGGVSVIKMPGPANRYLIFAGFDKLKDLWVKSQAHAAPAASPSWNYWNIQYGIPEVLEATSDEFVPQMLNLHSLNGVSFKKGCYPGQEVVARMHYLGKQKRRMYLAHVETGSPPQPGENVYNESNAAGQSVGKIVTTTASPQGGYDALVVMQIASVENRDRILTQQNAALKFKELPYFVEVEGNK